MLCCFSSSTSSDEAKDATSCGAEPQKIDANDPARYQQPEQITGFATPECATTNSAPSSTLQSSPPSQTPTTNTAQSPVKRKFTRKDLLFSKLVADSDAQKKDFVTLDFYPDSDTPLPFAIEDCKNVNMYLFTSLAQCQIDACQNCFIFCGPTEGPVFIRECSDCVIVVACQQLRLRDCKNIKIALYCKGQPIIESSSNITFACFTYNYPALVDQFERARLPIDKNDWANIYDFNPSTAAETNMCISSEPLPAACLLAPPAELVDFPVSSDALTSAVPFTLPPS